MRPSLYVNLEAIGHNVQVWSERVGSRPVWAVVKCDAYRMGMVEVARACLDAGAQRLCVVEISEARQLRDAGITAPIVHISATPSEDFEEALRLGVALSLGDVARAQELSVLAQKLRIPARAHIAIETGTGWWGVPYSEAAVFARRAAPLHNIEWEGAWAHIAGRDSMAAQSKRFQAAVASLRTNGLAVPSLHLTSTGPSVWGQSEGAARIGVGLYGSSMGDDDLLERLRTALEVRAPIYRIQSFTEPTPLGYGGTYVALPGQTIITLRIGYGEGIPKALAGRGSVMIAGTLCPIVGAIGMNFTMVAVPPNVDISSKEEAIVIGDIPGVRLDEVAAAAQTIPHNVVTMFGSGTPRKHVGAPAREPISKRT